MIRRIQTSLLAGALAFAPIGCTRARQPTTPSSALRPSVVARAPRSAPHELPSAHPVGFDDAADSDIDLDGLVDRVLTIPAFDRDPGRALTFLDLPPAIVAHRLTDGRYAVDDDLTRAALRALCPEAPTAALVDITPTTNDGNVDSDDTEQADTDLRLKTLYLDAFCALAWGRTIDQVATVLPSRLASANLRATQAVALVASMTGALRRVRFAFTLRDLEADFPLTGMASSSVPVAPDAPDSVDAGPPTEPPCIALAAETEALRVRALRGPASRNSQQTTTLTATRRCVSQPGGTWTLHFDALRFGAEADVGFSSVMSLAFTSPRPGTAWRAFELSPPWQQGTYATVDHGIEAVFDWDGDGRPESAVRSHSWEHEGASTSRLVLCTAREGAVVTYAQSPRDTIESLLDADGDQRPDLVLESPWRFVDGCGMSGVEHRGPAILAHSLVGGSFSTSDEVARDAFVQACEHHPMNGDDSSATDRDIWRIACARALGASPERIVSALRGAHRGRPRYQPLHNDQEICYPFQTLAALALIEPPFVDHARR